MAGTTLNVLKAVSKWGAFEIPSNVSLRGLGLIHLKTKKFELLYFVKVKWIILLAPLSKIKILTQNSLYKLSRSCALIDARNQA